MAIRDTKAWRVLAGLALLALALAWSPRRAFVGTLLGNSLGSFYLSSLLPVSVLDSKILISTFPSSEEPRIV